MAKIGRTDHREGYYWTQVKKHGSKYPQFHWPSVEILLNLVYTYDILTAQMARRMSHHGITKAAFSVLMILSRSASKACKQNEISQLMLVSRANITGLVDGLAREGYVERSHDPRDRRVNRVKILPKGEKLLKDLLPGYYKYVRDICSVFTVEEKRVLNELLTRLRKRTSEVKG